MLARAGSQLQNKKKNLVVHHTQQISMAAVAGDAENINKQARKMRINWIKNKQAANGLLSSAPVGGARAAYLCGRALGPLHPSRTDHVVPTLAVVGSLVM